MVRVGFPIRKSLDQSLLTAPQRLSQRATSFIASYHQGIHRMLLSRLIDHLSKKRSCTVRTAPQALRPPTHTASPALNALDDVKSPSYVSTDGADAHGRTLIHDVIDPPTRDMRGGELVFSYTSLPMGDRRGLVEPDGIEPTT